MIPQILKRSAGRRLRHWLVAAIALACAAAGLVTAAVASSAVAPLPPVFQVLVPCKVGGPGGLIAAIKAANRRGGGTLVLAGRCTYTLTRPDNRTDGANGLPVLTGRITIAGQTGTVIARRTTRTTANFRILAVAKRGRVAITNVSLTGGRLPAADAKGGGVDNEGTITSLSNDTIRNNRAGSGGGVYSIGTITNLSHDRISGNTAGNGGGVFNLGKIPNFADDTVTGNRAGIGGGVSNGGGVINLRRTLISNNRLTANGAGGGIANAFGRLNMSDDTVSGNTATSGPQAAGGGIDNSGKLTLTNSVVRDNVARGDGGGVQNEEQAAKPFVFIVRSTSVMNNTVTSAKGPAPGGGIYNAGAMSLTDATVRGNKATTSTGRAVGAGMYSSGSLTLTRTTTSGNVARDPGGAAEGGGLYVDEGSKKTALTDSTVSGNRAIGAAPHGGGILFAGGSPVTLARTAVTGNSPENCFPFGSVAGCRPFG